MLQITLPDNSKRDFNDPLTIEELASEIGSSLANSTIAGKMESWQ